MLDFKNQTLFLYTTASRDEEAGGEDLVIQAVVSRSGSSFPYFTGGQNEMEGVWEGGGGYDTCYVSYYFCFFIGFFLT